MDWNINIGHVTSLIIVLVALGAYKQRFDDMRTDLKEIKASLLAAIKDNTLIITDVAVLQQRMLTCEQDLLRCRDVVHHLTNAAQVAIATNEERAQRIEMRDLRKE